jgi:hypothetical protein
MQRREVSLASANCRGFFVFGEEKIKGFNAEFAEKTQRALSFGGGVSE